MGDALGSRGLYHATLWDSTGIHDLDSLLGGGSSHAYGINDAGQVVGYGKFGPDDGEGHAFLYDGSGVRNLGVLGDGTTSMATGINNRGQIVGASGPGAATPGWRAFLYDSTGMRDLGTLPGYDTSYADAINDAGQVVGYLFGAGGDTPFLWQNGVMTALEAPGEALGINAAGQVVGYTISPTDGQAYGAIWENGHLRKLGGLLMPGDRGWSVGTAWAINNRGQIIASAHHPNESTHSVLLTPVPVPHLRLSVEALAFGDELVGMTSAAQTIRLTNDGQTPLTVSEVYLDGVIGAAFAIVKDSGEGTLAPGASRTVEVTFTPSAPGNTSAGLFVTDNDPHSDSPNVVGLSGTGVAPVVTLSPSSVSFGSQIVGAGSDETVTVSNAGSAPLVLQKLNIEGADATEFSVTDPGLLTLSPGQSRAIHVGFTPTSSGNRSGTLVISTSAPGSPAKVPLTGTGLAPVVSFSPGSLQFGAQALGVVNDAQTVTLQNTGDAPLDIRSVAVVGANPGDFQIVADGWTGAHLLPGQIAALNLRFTPTAAGDRSARLTISDNAAGGQQAVDLSGTGAAPAASLTATTLNFADQLVNTTSGEQTVTLMNSGSAPLTLGTLTLSGANPGDFTATANPGALALAPGESRTIHIRFRPTAPGSRSASLAINDSAAGSPQSVTLSGTGTMPSITFGISRLAGPGSMSFGAQPLGFSSGPQTITLTNSGTAPLTISRITLEGADAGDFAIVTDSGTGTLAPGATRTITLRFTPTTLGDHTASLTVTDDAAGGQQAVNLTGTGVLPGDGNPGAGAIPTAVELVIAGVEAGSAPTPSPGPNPATTVAPGQHVTLKLLAKFADGAVADVTQDRNSHFGTSPAAGSFTGKNVWSAGSSDGGKTITFYGRYFIPLGRKRLVGTATLRVGPRGRNSRRPWWH